MPYWSDTLNLGKSPELLDEDQLLSVLWAKVDQLQNILKLALLQNGYDNVVVILVI
jgi:hypothetical protein